jgi:hypothetical protein
MRMPEAAQLTEAFPWNEAPHYLVRDRDQIYGAVVMRRIRAYNAQPRTERFKRQWT